MLFIMPYNDLDEVLAAANAYGYGLDRALRFVDGIAAGTVWVNTHNMVDPAVPFGGFKASGIGREHGKSIIDSDTEIKFVCIGY